MSEAIAPLQARATLRCRSAGVPVLQNEAAARWTLRHVAFNSGFEQRPTADDHWSPPRDLRPGAMRFELAIDMRDGRFTLQARPAQRRLDLQILLDSGARHLRRNLPRLVDDLAAASLAEVISLEILDETARPAAEGRLVEPLALLA